MMTVEEFMSAIDETEEKKSSITPRKNKQVLKKEKIKEKAFGTMAVGTAFAVLAGGAVPAIVSYVNSKDSDPAIVSYVNSKDSDIETGDKEVIDSSFKYALVANFVASNEDEVDLVANAIVDNTSLNDDEVKNFIKFYNMTLQEGDLTGTDLEIFRQLQDMVTILYNDVYNTQTVFDYTGVSNILQSDKATPEEKQNAMAGLSDTKVVTPSAILGYVYVSESQKDYMKKHANEYIGNVVFKENQDQILEFITEIEKLEEKIAIYNGKISDNPSKSEKYNKKINNCEEKIKNYKNEIENLKTQEQKYNERINNNLENSLKAIRENDMQALSELSQEFYDIYEDILNDENLYIEHSERWKVYLEYFKAISPIFGSYLSEKQVNEIESEKEGFSAEEYIKELTKKWTLDVAEIIEKSGEDGAYGKPITELEEKYNSSDASSANNSSYATGDDTKTEEKHGEQASGSKGKQETIKGSENLGTTTEKEETLPTPDNPPKDNVQEGGQEVGDPVIEDKPGEEIKEENTPPEVEKEQDEVIGETEEVYVDANGEEFDSVKTEEEFAANSLAKSLR